MRRRCGKNTLYPKQTEIPAGNPASFRAGSPQLDEIPCSLLLEAQAAFLQPLGAMGSWVSVNLLGFKQQ